MGDSASGLTSQERNFHPTYRPDIDGLRAVAVLSVVMFHAFPVRLRGGFVGVDIFFVISGFLISNIIFRSLHRGDFSFSEFYAHRVRRIFPALIVVLIAVYGLGWFVLLPDEFKQLGMHMAAGAGFAQNFVLWLEAGYFDTASELKPLMHLWSLAIEEQFYLIYPALIWITWRLGGHLSKAVIVLGLLSFSANVSGIGRDAVGTFFAPHTRFWELLAGAVLAGLHALKETRRSLAVPRDATLNSLASALGLALIVAAVFVTHRDKPFPGWWALPPVAGAFLLIWADPQAWVNRKILANKPMVFVGLISYPLYLWHWLILSFARIVEGEALSLGTGAGAVSLSFLLAWLTYRFIERPIRFGRKTWLKTAALSASMALIAYVGFSAYEKDGLEFRVKEFARISKAAGEWQYPGNLNRRSFNGVDYLFKKSKKSDITLFVGDSNIEQFYPRIDELISTGPDKTNSVIFKTGGGCFPVPNVKYDRPHKHCDGLMKDAFALAKGRADVVSVVIGGHWNLYLSGGYGLAEKIYYGNDGYKDSLRKLSSSIKSLVALKKEVYLLLNVPAGVELDPKYIVQRKLGNFPNVFQIRNGGIDRIKLDERYGLIQAELTHVANHAGARLIKPIDFLCRERCDSLDAMGEPIYKDTSHLRPSFVRKQVEFMDVTVQRL